jgi:putative membrane protein
MIKRYNEHAANERTFLAWVRTAIAVMAFGFLVERFDLFIRFASREPAGSAEFSQSRNVADVAGLAFVLIGVAIIVVAAFRFFRTAKLIDAEGDTAGPGVRFDLALAALLVLLGCSLLLYLPQAGLRPP